MKSISLPTLLSLLLAAWAAAQPPAPSAVLELEKAIFAEETAGNPEQAVALYSKLIEDPALPPAKKEEALFRMGRALGELGRTAESKAAFQRCLTEYPNGAFAERVHESLREPLGGAEIAASVSLLGLWEYAAGYLELLPGNRFRGLPRPLDSRDLNAPAPPLATGTYQIDGNTLELRVAEGGTQKFEWSLLEGQLFIKEAGGEEIVHRRARRPFRFHKGIDSREKIEALMNLKAAEAAPVSEYLAQAGKPEAALEMIALSAPVSAELRRMTIGTTAELLTETGLDVLALTERLLGANDVNGAQEALSAFDKLDWINGGTPRLGPYGPETTDIAGEWRGELRGASVTYHFLANGPAGVVTPESEEARNIRYYVRGHRLTLRDDSRSANAEHAIFLLHQDELALYDEESGEAMGTFRRTDPGHDDALASYFGDQFEALRVMLELTRHPQFRKRLIEYCYSVATHCEDTTAGLLARTAVRQMMQVEAAYHVGDLPKATALKTAFSGTLELLMLKSLPGQIAEFGIISPKPAETENPFPSIYDGAIHLLPATDVPVGEGLYRIQGEMLRKTILKGDLLSRVIDAAPPEIGEVFLKEFEGFSRKEITYLLEDSLSVELVREPLALKVIAFRHPIASVASEFGDILGREIEALPKSEGAWSWRVDRTRERGLMPERIFVGAEPFLPAEVPNVRGQHPRLAHGRFLYEAYVSRQADGRSALIPEGRFALIEQNGKRIAVRCDSREQITILTPAPDGGKPVVGSVELQWGQGPAGSVRASYSQNGFNFQFDSNAPNRLMGGGPDPISFARTEWKEPAQVRFDEPALRWYYVK